MNEQKIYTKHNIPNFLHKPYTILLNFIMMLQDSFLWKQKKHGCNANATAGETNSLLKVRNFLHNHYFGVSTILPLNKWECFPQVYKKKIV